MSKSLVLERDERYPFYYIAEVEEPCKLDRVVNMSDDEYVAYLAVHTLFEFWQEKLELMMNEGK